MISRTVRERLNAAPGTLRGMGCMLVATLLSAGMVACARHVSKEIHPFEITFFRSLFGLLVFAPVFVRHGWAPLRTHRLHLHACRGVIHVTATMLFFLAVSMSPLAKMTAVFFSAPLFAGLLAILILRETAHARRIGAITAGFAGAIIVIHPGEGEVDVGALVMLVSAALWGFGLLVIKVLSRTESSLTTTVYMGFFMTPIALIAAVPYWETPNWTQFGWLAAVGCLGGVNHLFLAQAFKEADMTAVLPFDFTRLIWAAILGYLAFAEIPEVWTWLGGTLIFVSATYISVREGKARAATAR